MFIVADGNNMAWAGFHSLRRAMGAEEPASLVRAGLLGLTQSVVGVIVRAGEPPRQGAPQAMASMFAGRVTRMAAVFDEGRPLRRRAIFPGYQLSRESNSSFRDNEPYVLEAIRQFVEMAESLPIETVRGVNTEADDLIAHLVLAPGAGPVRIASTDRDFLQLVDERVSIYSPVKRVVIDAAGFEDAVAPRLADGSPVTFPRERYLDYRAASGDSSDDLPGIPGVGPVSAARLLARAELDVYLDDPSRAAVALGRRSAKLEAALASDEARAIVARNRDLMDLRLAARRYENLEGMVRRGKWDESGFRAWVGDQRIAGLDVEAAVRAMESMARSQ